MAAAYPLLENILAQPDALGKVRKHHLGEGLPDLLKAAELLRAAPSIIVAGMGASYYACLPFVLSLVQDGQRTALLEASELLHYQMESVLPGSLVMLVSRSGESIEIARLLPLLKDRGARLLGVTNVPGSRLAQDAEAVLLLGSPADQLVAVQTYTGTLAALYLLGEAAANRLAAPSLKALDEAIEASAHILPVLEAESQGWQSFFDGRPDLYLLGRGASLASTLEGALLFSEVSKFPAVAMSAGQFRHGPAEVIGAGFRGILFTPDDHTRDLGLSLAREIAVRGGQARLVGPSAESPDQDGLEYWNIPPAKKGLAPLLEILPLQLAACRLAEWRGIPPGQFRHLGQVARSEASF